MMRVLISGGPGSGCTSTARAIGEQLGLPVFDSDSYFHKPTDPPFQQQYSPEERRTMLASALSVEPNWILCGSVATWGLDSLEPTHGVLLSPPKEMRLERLLNRQRNHFGSRINPEGDMSDEHQSFMEWAAGYEERTDFGRNLKTDRAFLEAHCKHLATLIENEAMEEIVLKVISFLADATIAK